MLDGRLHPRGRWTFRGRHLSKGAFDRFWHDVCAEGGIVDVHWTNCVSATRVGLANGATCEELKRTIPDPERSRTEDTWQTVIERGAAILVERGIRD